MNNVRGKYMNIIINMQIINKLFNIYTSYIIKSNNYSLPYRTKLIFLKHLFLLFNLYFTEE